MIVSPYQGGSRGARRRVLFLTTSMPVGGAETLLVNLMRRLDPHRFACELGCLKQLGPLGEVLKGEFPCHWGLLSHKYDLRILPRLTRLLRSRRIEAVVTVGAGDKMFWGRLAARAAGVRAVVSALHATGWPDPIGRLNRLLTPLTDAFVGVARAHGRYLIDQERLPAEKVHVIPNGVDVATFRPRPDRAGVRRALGLAHDAPTVGIVAALRPEKNHRLFLRAARMVLREVSDARFVIVGDGPLRPALEREACELGIRRAVHFLGTRGDVADVLAAVDVFALSSDSEASPVSILEAMACGLPVVATRVGSVDESVDEGRTGLLVPPGDAARLAGRLIELLRQPRLAHEFGRAGRRKAVRSGSLERMVHGYQSLLENLCERASGRFSPLSGAIR